MNKNSNKNNQSRMTMTPPEWDLLLSAAQKNRHERIATMIRDEGVNPSHSNGVGQSALHIAALWGHVESVRVLCEMGADVNARNKLTGATPLHMVVQSGNKSTAARQMDVADVLVRHGADVGLGDFYGNLPSEYHEKQYGDDHPLASKLRPRVPEIFAAAERRDVSEIESLLSSDRRGDDDGATTGIVRQRHLGKTPVSYVVGEILSAVEQTNDDGGVIQDADDRKADVGKLLSVLKLLAGAGGAASPDSDDDDGARMRKMRGDGEDDEPPLDRVLSALRDAYKRGEGESGSFSIVTLEEAAATLHEGATTPGRGTEVLPESIQMTMHQAARRGEMKLLRFFVERMGVDPNVTNRQGMTTLQFASRSGRCDVVRYLLTRPDIDVRRRDQRGQSALDSAVCNDKQDVVLALQQYMNDHDDDSKQPPTSS